MIPADRKARLAAWHAELAAAFAARRCWCGAWAVAVAPGELECRSETGILLRPAQPDRNRCLKHTASLLPGGAPATSRSESRGIGPDLIRPASYQHRHRGFDVRRRGHGADQSFSGQQQCPGPSRFTPDCCR
jgi:hypothetical protein